MQTPLETEESVDDAAARTRAGLSRVPVAALSQQLRRYGIDNATIEGVRPLRAGQTLVGTARTLRYLPLREDLFGAFGGGYNMQKQLFDSLDDGDVVVIDARGDATAGTFGDALALRARQRGAAGIISDGGVRDADAVTATGLPVFTGGAHPAVLGRRHVPWEYDVTIACGGTVVQPGDIIVADADGVVVIPPALVEEVLEAAAAQEIEDAWIARRVAEGHPLEGLFPMNASWRARFDARDATGDALGAVDTAGEEAAR